MEAVLIDQFVVPKGAVEEFLQHVHFSANIVKTRPVLSKATSCNALPVTDA